MSDTYLTHKISTRPDGATVALEVSYLTGDESHALAALNDAYAAARQAIESGCKPCGS
jgi:hypothetical protein